MHRLESDAACGHFSFAFFTPPTMKKTFPFRVALKDSPSGSNMPKIGGGATLSVFVKSVANRVELAPSP
jgi:hypothetical protein